MPAQHALASTPRRAGNVFGPRSWPSSWRRHVAGS